MEYLSNSSQLKSAYQLIKPNETLSDEQINEIISKIVQIKKIKNSDIFADSLEKILKKRNRLIKYKKSLKELYEEKIELTNEEHKDMLLSIWTHFKNDEPIELVDKKWSKSNIF